jgi:DedD protein
VQVGAFLEDAKVREARAKVEKLGMKTYTQPVDTPTGKRIRVRIGPFATKAEADKAAARIKAEGQTAVVLAL